MQTSSRLCAGFERKCVKLASHFAFQSRVDHLVLRHPRFASEGGGANNGLVVVAVAGEVLDLNVGVCESGSQERFQVAWAHCHVASNGIVDEFELAQPKGPEQMTITKVLVA
jgi:hypothetical protein